MKSALPLFLCIFFIACEKETIEPAPTDQRTEVGTWKIVPVGNPGDTYSFKLWTSEDEYDTLISGLVSDGAVNIALISGMQYDITYRDTALIGVHYVIENEGTPQADTISINYFWHQIIHRDAGYSPVSYTDSIPATSY